MNEAVLELAVKNSAQEFLQSIWPQKGVNFLLIYLTVKTDKASLPYHKA